MSEYKAGKAIVTNGSDQVLGVGTSWLTYVKPSDTLTIGEDSATVLSIEDNNALTLTAVWAFDTVFKSSYIIQEYVLPEQPSIYHTWDVTTSAWIVSQTSIDQLTAQKKLDITAYKRILTSVDGPFLGGEVKTDPEAYQNILNRVAYIEEVIAVSGTYPTELLKWYYSDNVTFYTFVAYMGTPAEVVMRNGLANIATLIERRNGDCFVYEKEKWVEVTDIAEDTGLTLAERYTALVAYDVTADWGGYPAS